jgi:DNA-binding transcriptional regulator/RsmH inhibitor MraZ
MDSDMAEGCPDRWPSASRDSPEPRVRSRLAADSTVILVGRHSYFEIWNAENFETAQEIECREIADDAFGIL